MFHIIQFLFQGFIHAVSGYDYLYQFSVISVVIFLQKSFVNFSKISLQHYQVSFKIGKQPHVYLATFVLKCSNVKFQSISNQSLDNALSKSYILQCYEIIWDLVLHSRRHSYVSTLVCFKLVLFDEKFDARFTL